MKFGSSVADIFVGVGLRVKQTQQTSP